MIHIDVGQRSPEWLAARRGIPTASQFNRILTPKTRKPSTQSVGYMYDLIAEWATGDTVDAVTNQWMERGKELEHEALAWYQFETGNDVRAAGFCLLDDRSAGCSPDGLCGDDGGVEVKCLSAGQHLRVVDADAPEDDGYICQVQGCMWITGAKWWDRVWYNGSHHFPSRWVRTVRDDEFINVLASEVASFNATMAVAKDRLIAKGLRQVSNQQREAVAVATWGLGPDNDEEPF